MKHFLTATLLAACSSVLFAQSGSPTSSASDVHFSASVRERTNVTQWFAATPNAEQYAHQDSLVRLAVWQRMHHWDYQLELGQSAELWLPTDAVSTVSAQGQLGLGGTYYASNSNNDMPAAASFRQGFLRYHFADDKSAIRIGRFEFFEGQETTPGNSTLAWLQTNRVAQRLVGNFGFSNGQRSFDGADAKLGGKDWDLTAMAGRAIQGVFNMNANPELNVDIQYLAYTRSLARQHVLLRGFGLGYHDGRTGLTKTDNRSAAARAQDHKNIRIGTYGGDMIATAPVATGVTADVVLWGAGQFGSWGKLGDSAGAVAAEGGLHLDSVRTTPWIRGGYFRSTGDNNATDGTHNTFFQVLPTPRVYARFPFYNLMNSTDSFAQVVDKPSKRIDLRSDLHFLKLTSASDFWYQGGGAFDNTVFGYTGRPANSHNSFSSVFDASADIALTKQLSLGTYYAHAYGKSVIGAIYPKATGANYGFFELDYKFQGLLSRSSY
ncbi:alginate export family protein [Silvibacterium dinghuense]|uniref:alginate export family protein n=1 Tax=Silvibacterium dinghuense TaxID=1560006 RepID=UPI00199243D3|nr:alginate export family protein [Silvibacterium dinghuense]GGG91888.1 hypothetical protein GCM10011586_03150 [Silvibacterium dinghuense]